MTKPTWSPLVHFEWVAHIYFTSFFITNTQIFKGKNVLVRYINGLSPETEEITHPVFHLGFYWGSHVNKMGTPGSDLCVSVLSSIWNGLHFWVLKIVLLVCIIVGSNHLWNQIWTPVPYHCFSSPIRSWDFTSILLAHSELVHVSEGIFCKEITAPLPKFTIYLTVKLFSVEYNPSRNSPTESLCPLGQQYCSLSKYSQHSEL